MVSSGGGERFGIGPDTYFEAVDGLGFLQWFAGLGSRFSQRSRQGDGGAEVVAEGDEQVDGGVHAH